MICPKCKQETTDNSRFCNHCGSNLTGEPLTMSIQEAADLIGCNRQTILNLIERDVLLFAGSMEHRKTYVYRQSVIDFCNSYPDLQKHLTSIAKYEYELSRKEIQYHSLQLDLHSKVIEILAKSLLEPSIYKMLKEVLSGRHSVSHLAYKHNLSKSYLLKVLNNALDDLDRKIKRYSNIADVIHANTYLNKVIKEQSEQIQELKARVALGIDAPKVDTIQDTPTDPSSYSINIFPFSNLCLDVLANHNVTDLHFFIKVSRREVSCWDGMTNSIFWEIDNALKSVGLGFRDKYRAPMSNKGLGQNISSNESNGSICLKEASVQGNSASVRSFPVEDYPFSVRCSNVLRMNGIEDLIYFTQITEKEAAQRLRNCGRKLLTEIKTTLEALGLEFKPKERRTRPHEPKSIDSQNKRDHIMIGDNTLTNESHTKDNNKDWEKTNAGYKWVKERVAEGWERKQIIEGFNKLHETDPKNFSSKSGRPLTAALLSQWIKEMGIPSNTSKSVSDAIKWRQNSKGYHWVAEQLRNNRPLEEILAEFNERHKTDLEFSSIYGTEIKIGTLLKWKKEIESKKYGEF